MPFARYSWLRFSYLAWPILLGGFCFRLWRWSYPESPSSSDSQASAINVGEPPGLRPISQYAFETNDTTLIHSIAKTYNFDSRKGSRFTVRVPAAQAQHFLSLVPHATLVEFDTRAAALKLRDTDRAGYQDYNEIQQVFGDYEAEHSTSFRSWICVDEVTRWPPHRRAQVNR